MLTRLKKHRRNIKIYLPKPSNKNVLTKYSTTKRLVIPGCQLICKWLTTTTSSQSTNFESHSGHHTCKRSFARYSTLASHICWIAEYSCESCRATFSTEKQLKHHLRVLSCRHALPRDPKRRKTSTPPRIHDVSRVMSTVVMYLLLIQNEMKTMCLRFRERERAHTHTLYTRHTNNRTV